MKFYLIATSLLCYLSTANANYVACPSAATVQQAIMRGEGRVIGRVDAANFRYEVLLLTQEWDWEIDWRFSAIVAANNKSEAMQKVTTLAEHLVLENPHSDEIGHSQLCYYQSGAMRYSARHSMVT